MTIMSTPTEREAMILPNLIPGFCINHQKRKAVGKAGKAKHKIKRYLCSECFDKWMRTKEDYNVWCSTATDTHDWEYVGERGRSQEISRRPEMERE
jgi:hypothetical protein